MAGRAEESQARLHVVVRGRVQGVGFRWFVRERARELGLAGWVANLADGTVEIEAEGPSLAIAALREQLQRGPDGAHVAMVEDKPATGEALPRPFAIQR